MGRLTGEMRGCKYLKPLPYQGVGVGHLTEEAIFAV